MGRKLKEIEVEEISLVDAASNRKKFLIIKKELGEGAGVGGPRQGLGGAKYCVCPECGYAVEHKQLGEGKSKPCAQIKCPECGTKMAGSKTKGLSKLKNINVSLESDGTIGGTKIFVNKEELKDVTDFHFSFYKPKTMGDELVVNPISCSYSKVTESEDGFKHIDTFYLSKGVTKEMKELKQQLKDYLGEDFSEEEFEKAVKKLDEKVVNALKGALNILNKYKGDFPDELKKAVAVLAKHVGYGYPAKKDLEKAGAKLSKSTLEKIQSAVKALKALNDLLPEENQLKIEKEAVIKDEVLKAEFEKIHKALEKLEMSEGDKDKDKDKDKDPLKAIHKRIETLEKAKGIKKSIDGDGDGDSKEKWPSFTGLDKE